MRINLRTDDVELIGQVELEKDRQAIDGQLVGRGFWHCNASRDNKWAAGDTFGGNVWLVNVQTGERHWLASDTKMKPDHAHDMDRSGMGFAFMEAFMDEVQVESVPGKGTTVWMKKTTGGEKKEAVWTTQSH